MNKPEHPNIIPIADQGQNIGKSTFTCKVIDKFSQTHTIYALKTTPHLQKSVCTATLIKQREEFIFMKEKVNAGNKKSVRTLQQVQRNPGKNTMINVKN